MFRKRFELLSIIGSPVYRGDKQDIDIDFDIRTISVSVKDYDLAKEIQGKINELCKLYIKTLRLKYYQDR